MLKKITNLKSEEVFILTSFANINLEKLLSGDMIDESNLKYEMLLKTSSLPENANVDMSVNAVIDDLMFDNYDIYHKIKENEKRIFEVENFADFINEENGDVNLPEILSNSLNSITLSTVRGLMFSGFKGTFLHNAILPVIDPNSLIKKENQ